MDGEVHDRAELVGRAGGRRDEVDVAEAVALERPPQQRLIHRVWLPAHRAHPGGCCLESVEADVGADVEIERAGRGVEDGGKDMRVPVATLAQDCPRDVPVHLRHVHSHAVRTRGLGCVAPQVDRREHAARSCIGREIATAALREAVSARSFRCFRHVGQERERHQRPHHPRAAGPAVRPSLVCQVSSIEYGKF